MATLTLVSRQKMGGAFSSHSQRRGCCGTFLLHCSCITAGRGQGSGTTAPGAPPIWASSWERNNFTRPKCVGDHVPLVVVGPRWGAASHKAVSSSQQHEYFTVTTGEWAAAGHGCIINTSPLALIITRYCLDTGALCSAAH